LAPWFRRHPALKAAYAEARRRFEGRPGVLGVGIGRRFHESANGYSPQRDAHDGLCLKIFVERKRDAVPRRERIPKWLVVSVPGRRKRVRVDVDVVAAGDPSRRREPARQDAGRAWPHHGLIDPGHLFAFGRAPAAQTPSPFRPSDAELGTTGALLRFVDGSKWAVSAGHVFTSPCDDRYGAPTTPRALGVRDATWDTTAADGFYPPTILGSIGIRDLMLFPVPPQFLPADGAATWPDGFDGTLATQADIERAILDERPTAFLWVDRYGARPRALPVDLEAAIPVFEARVKCSGATRSFTYVTTWPLRFLPGAETTIGGDSGAPVFLWGEDNTTCRMLGMHFLEWKNHSFAMDARSFLREVLLSELGRDVFFA